MMRRIVHLTVTMWVVVVGLSLYGIGYGDLRPAPEGCCRSFFGATCCGPESRAGIFGCQTGASRTVPRP